MTDLKNIKLLVMDVDGTMTDGKIYVGSNGEIFKAFNVKDGYALIQCAGYGIKTAIITGKTSEIVESRAKTLRIDEVFQGVMNKPEIMEKILNKYGFQWSEAAYIGDDDNDLECMKKCGCSACPSDAMESVINSVDIVCRRKGGDGAVREFLEKVFAERRR